MVEWIKIPIEVMCCHEDGNTEMNIEADDPEVPSYLAKCPKCRKEIIISFGSFLHKSKTKR